LYHLAGFDSLIIMGVSGG